MPPYCSVVLTVVTSDCGLAYCLRCYLCAVYWHLDVLGRLGACHIYVVAGLSVLVLCVGFKVGTARPKIEGGLRQQTVLGL